MGSQEQFRAFALDQGVPVYIGTYDAESAKVKDAVAQAVLASARIGEVDFEAQVLRNASIWRARTEPTAKGSELVSLVQLNTQRYFSGGKPRTIKLTVHDGKWVVTEPGSGMNPHIYTDADKAMAKVRELAQ